MSSPVSKQQEEIVAGGDIAPFQQIKDFSVLLKEEKEKAIEKEPGKEVDKNRIKILVLSGSNMKR